MVQYPPDDLSGFDTQRDDPEDEQEPESDRQGDSSESIEGEEASMPSDNHDGPIPPEQLHLPEGYDHERDSKYIPTQMDLQRAALNALDRETAFVVYYHDQPRVIANRLEELAEVARAAASIKGDHQPKAIRLGLALQVEYWWSRNKLTRWKDLVSPMLIQALDLHDSELESEIYRAWATYLYITAETDVEAARNAISAAEDYASDSGREDLQLLMRAERFNIDVLDITLDQACAQAADILAGARRMRFDYVRGRVYRSLARAYAKAGLPVDVFNYAQQALAVFSLEQDYSAMAACISMMFNSLYRNRPASDSYANQLLAYLDSLALRSVSPQVPAGFYYAHALRCFRRDEYDSAREFMLKAWLHYRVMRFRLSLMRVEHMLGLIQTKRHHWWAAERYLTACRDFYERIGDPAHAIHARHGLAFIPFEQGDYPRALAALEDVLHHAQRLEETESRVRLVKLITDDINEVKRRIDGGAAS